MKRAVTVFPGRAVWHGRLTNERGEQTVCLPCQVSTICEVGSHLRAVRAIRCLTPPRECVYERLTRAGLSLLPKESHSATLTGSLA